VTELNATNQIFIRKLTAIVTANLVNENFGARELERESGISLYRLNRRLNSISGKTTSQFIREIRLDKALEMLQNESFTVSEVSYRTGFNSPSYFIACFHDYFGYPPGKVQRFGIHKDEESQSEASIQKKQRPAGRTIIFALSGALILAVIIYFFIRLFSDNFSADGIRSDLNNRTSIAVLPFRNFSINSADQYVYDGIMEEIFNSLTKIHVFGVISHTSVEQYRNTTKTVSEIGKTLDVDYIVEGSGQKFGKTFRIRVQLIDANTDLHIWSKPFQYKMKETRKLFRIQSRIAKNIASELKATITLKERELIEKIPTASNTAYNLYLKANSFQKDIEATRNHSSYQTAVNLFNAALDIDSTFARAYTGLAFAYWNRYFYETYFKEDFLDSCRILAEKALSCDDQLDEAYFMKGQYYNVNGQSSEALLNYNMALEINPNYYEAYLRKGNLLTRVLGDYVKGLDNYHQALNLIRGEGRPVILKSLGRAYGDAGFIEKAKYYYDEAFFLDSNKVSWLGNIAFLEFCDENFEEALKLWKQLEDIDSSRYASENYYYVTPGHNEEAFVQAVKDVETLKKSGTLNLVRSHRTGYAFWQVGKKKEAEYYFNQQIKYSEESIKLNRDIDQRKAAQYDLAGTYAFLGDKVKAYKYLDEVAQKNTFPLWMLIFAKHDLLFENISKEERFQKILRTIESKYQAEHERVWKWLEEQGNQ